MRLISILLQEGEVRHNQLAGVMSKRSLSDCCTLPEYEMRQGGTSQSALRVVVAGSRTYNNYNDFTILLDRIFADTPNITMISGGADGVDNLASRYAKERNHKLVVYYPDYSAFGKRAPLHRNKIMAQEGDMLLAIWDGKSTGTAHMISSMKELGKPAHVVKFQ